MRSTKFLCTVLAFGLTALFILMSSHPVSAAATEKVIYSFTGGKDEGSPYAGLVFDSAGNLYGTNAGGGVSDYYGTAFKLSPTRNGAWKITVMHIFTGGTDGANPYSNLILDKAGNVYGTTTSGGDLNYCEGLGCGTVFELSPTSGGGWKETILHRFTGGWDGADPYSGLVIDNAGDLYGTTRLGGELSGGRSGSGVVFELSQSSNGWKDTRLYTFTGGDDGSDLYSGLTLDAAGNLYGVATEGGRYGAGTVFRLEPGSTSWKLRVLHQFDYGYGGFIPRGALTLDSAGNLYGTTSEGGSEGNGNVFELTPNSDGSWKETVIHNFTGNGGRYPLAGVISDSAVNLYGTTSYGGTVDGTAFKLSLSSNGKWQQTVLHSFTGGKDGGAPYGGLMLDKSGNVYGTTTAGGDLGWGAVFQIVP